MFHILLQIPYLIIASSLLFNRLTVTQSPPNSNDTCTSMTPQGSNVLVSTLSPIIFTATLVANTTTTSSPSYLVTLTDGDSDEGFISYFIQARAISLDANGMDFTIGYFDPLNGDASSLLIDCPGGVQNVATRANDSVIRTVNYNWHPPQDYQGQFYFLANVLVENTTNWLGLKTPSFVLNPSMRTEAITPQIEDLIY